MKSKINFVPEKSVQKASWEEILIMTDGRILTHNLTPAMAAALRHLNPDDKPMQQRAIISKEERSHGISART
jgi:hypothetical protein